MFRYLVVWKIHSCPFQKIIAAMDRKNEDFDKLLECSICLEQIKSPKMLLCQHSFCLRPCLENIFQSNVRDLNGKSKVVCPLCRRAFRYSSLETIPDDLKLKSLLEIRINQLLKENVEIPSANGTLIFVL